MLTITHAEHVRLVAMVNEDQQRVALSLKRKRNTASNFLTVFLKNHS